MSKQCKAVQGREQSEARRGAPQPGRQQSLPLLLLDCQMLGWSRPAPLARCLSRAELSAWPHGSGTVPLLDFHTQLTGALPPACLLPAAGGEDVPPTRQTLLSFATSLTFITVGAFFVGSMTRKYILQPPEGRPSYAAGSGGSGSKGKASKRSGSKQQGARGKGAAPSVQELVTQHGGGSLLSSEGPQLAPAAVAASTDQRNAAAPAAVAATAVEPAAEGVSAPGSGIQHSAEPAPQAGGQQQAVPAVDQQQQQTAAQQAGAAPPAEAAQQAQPCGQQAAGDSWCEDTLGPAVAAADAAAAGAAALAAAAPILDCRRVWILSRPTESGGSVALRLLFPVGDAGEEQNCVALLAAEEDAEAAQRALAGLLGLPTTPQRVSAERIAGEAGRRRWAAAFYPAGSLAGALAAVEDAAAAQQEAEGEAAAAGAGQAAAGEGPTDPVDLLQAVLQQQALLLSGEQMQAVAAALESTPTGRAQESTRAAGSSGAGGGSSSSNGGSSSRGAASTGGSGLASPQSTAAQQAAAAGAGRTGQASQGASSAAASAGAAAAAGQRGPAAWDPSTERLPRRQDDPGWWLSLPVLHVAQLVYSDGAKGLMSVPLTLPRLGPGEGQGGSDDGAEERLERRLVAFESLRDAEGLLECPLEASGAWVVTGGGW